MARKIDYNNLTADDLEYMSTRGWLVAEGDYQGFKTSETLAAWREDGTVPDAPADEDEDEGIAYADAKVAELRAELEARSLPTEGTKAELIARLEANDAETADEEDDEEEADA